MSNKLATKHNPRIERINALHAQAMKVVGEINHLKEFAVAIAAKAGAELIALKEELPHGQFEDAVEKHCKFAIRTARNYMALTSELRARFPKNQTVSLLKSATVADLPSAAIEQIAPKLNKLVEGRTLTELFYAWDIIKKKPKQLAAATVEAAQAADHPDDDTVADSAERVTELWLNSLEDSLKATSAHVQVFTAAQLQRFNRLLERALKKANPARKFS